jgi:hypothetical protein
LAEENNANLKFCEYSKYDEFKTFLTRSTKYKSLNILQNNEPQKEDVVVIKGVPFVVQEKIFERNSFLLSAINNSRMPIVIIHTIYNAPTLESSVYRELPKEIIQSKIPIIEFKIETFNNQD